MDNIRLVQLNNYVKPDMDSFYYGNKDYITNGKNNCFFEYIIERYNGSPTNQSIINVYQSLLYGRGLVIKGEEDLYEELYEIFNKTAQRNTLNDFKMFGMAAVKLVRNVGGSLGQIKHFPINKLALEKVDGGGEMKNVWYSFDWKKKYKYKPTPIPLFNGRMTDKEMILLIKPYQAGNYYYTYPDYLSGLQYCAIEEEISNFSYNHIKNGLSFGYVINFNNGASVSAEQKDEIERRIKEKLAGSENAGKFVLSFNDDKEHEVTVMPLDVNDAHNQWESLRDDAKYQILTAHGAYPNLFGIKSESGFANNADELNVQSKLLQDYQIVPKQEIFLDMLKPAFELAGLETDLEYLPLRETYSSENDEEIIEDETVNDEEEVEGINTELSKDYNCDNVDLEALFAKGEDIDIVEWELLDDRRCNEITLKEDTLNTVFEFAKTPKGVRGNDKELKSKKESYQDTSLFKIRYRYAGNPRPQRDFCQKVMFTNKVYRAEDLENAKGVNPGFGINGARNYNIFKFKGGPNCRHYWQRVIYLRKNNKAISASEAREMINALEPSDRKDARIEKNPKEVAIRPEDMPNNGYYKKR